MDNRPPIWIFISILLLFIGSFLHGLNSINAHDEFDAHIKQTAAPAFIHTTEDFTAPGGCKYILFKSNGIVTSSIELMNSMGLPECSAFRDVLDGGVGE